MKRIIFLTLISGAILSCSKQEIQDEQFTVEAGLPSQVSKTSLGGKVGNSWPLVWSEGDCLNLNGVLSSPLASADAGASSASFKFSGVGGSSVWNYTYCGVAGSDCTVVFPSSQDSNAGNIDLNSLPMYASSASVSSITLLPLGAVLRFSFTSSSAVTLSQIQLRAIGGESICGDYTVGKNASGLLNGVLTVAGNNRDNLLVSAGVALSSYPSAFCIVIPAGTYSAGFYARIIASDGKIMEVWFNTKSNKTLSEGTLYDFGEAAFVPMGTSIMTQMSTEQFAVDTIGY